MSRVLNDRNFLTVSYSELWHKINYYGIQAVLVLFLTKQFQISDDASYTIYGVYTALSFGFSILGGFVSDKVLNIFDTAMMGCALIFIGSMILASNNFHDLYVGLSFTLVGFGLLKPCTPGMIGMIVQQDSEIRNRLFSLFYLIANTGSISGPLLYGILSNNHHFKEAYMCGALGILSALSLLFFSKKCMVEQYKKNIKNYLVAILIVVLSLELSIVLLENKDLFLWFFIFVLALSLAVLYNITKNISRDEKQSLAKLINPILSTILYFTVLLQIYSSLTLFIDRAVDKHIFGWDIPTAWFGSVEPILLILIVPFLNLLWDGLLKKGIVIGSQQKVTIGLFISGISFLIFSYCAEIKSSHTLTVFFLLFLGYGLLAISEICIVPITLSLINLYTPSKFKSTFMGYFYFFLMSSGYLSGLLAKFLVSGFFYYRYSAFFLIIGFIVFTLTMMLLIIRSYVEKRLFTNC